MTCLCHTKCLTKCDLFVPLCSCVSCVNSFSSFMDDLFVPSVLVVSGHFSVPSVSSFLVFANDLLSLCLSVSSVTSFPFLWMIFLSLVSGGGVRLCVPRRVH